jgi:hypothetical protein
MENLTQLTLIPLIGWASGVSLYLTTAIVGVGGRMGWLDLPEGMGVVENPLVIGGSSLLYAVEFVADKIPLVDSAWDTFHTFIRPAGAATVGYLAGTEYGAMAQTILALLTGTIALDSHAVKAASRLAINTSPEPVSNIVASATEDALVIGLFWFYIKHPVLATVIVILLLVASFFILRALWRFVRSLFKRKPLEAAAQSNQTATPNTPDSASRN